MSLWRMNQSCQNLGSSGEFFLTPMHVHGAMLGAAAQGRHGLSRDSAARQDQMPLLPHGTFPVPRFEL